MVNAVALYMLASGHASTMIAGIGVALVALVIDCADGMVARLTRQTSRIGEWLDGLGAYALYAWFHLCGGIGAARALSGERIVTFSAEETLGVWLVAAGAVAGSAMLVSVVAAGKFSALFPSVGKESLVARRGSGWYGALFTIGRNLSFPSGLVLPITAIGIAFAAYDVVLASYALINIAVLVAVLLRCVWLSRTDRDA
jgi:phosphatidylglycerophosphate synthase